MRKIYCDRCPVEIREDEVSVVSIHRCATGKPEMREVEICPMCKVKIRDFIIGEESSILEPSQEVIEEPSLCQDTPDPLVI